MSSGLIPDLSSAGSVVYESRSVLLLAKTQSVLLTHSHYKHFTINSGTSVSHGPNVFSGGNIFAMIITNPWFYCIQKPQTSPNISD